MDRIWVRKISVRKSSREAASVHSTRRVRAGGEGASLEEPIWAHRHFRINADCPIPPVRRFGEPARTQFQSYFDLFPNLKIITHHLGAMVPYFSGRTGPGLDQLGARTEDEDLTIHSRRLKKRPQDYFKMFYADTATFGSRAALQCGLEFFGADQVLFASDSPFDPEKGPGYIRETIRCIEELPISAEDREKIYQGNARRLCALNLS